jgi:ABC-2 type transport system permease protein
MNVTVGPVTQAGVIHSEWIKLRTVRSTVIAAALTVTVMVVFPLPLPYRSSFNPVDESLLGVYLAALTVSILGVLSITGEYATGMIRATFCAVPRRLPVLWGKLVVLALAAFTLALSSSLAAFLIEQARYGRHGVSLGAPGALRAVVGAALYLTIMGLLGLGLGALIRSTAGGVTAAVGLVFVLPYLADLLLPSWRPHIVPYLPAQAGQALFVVSRRGQDLLHPWAGLAVFIGYAAVAIAAAAIALRRRDVTAQLRWRDRARVLAFSGRSAAGRSADELATAPVVAAPADGTPDAMLPGPVAVGPVTQAGVIRSEWIKLRSLRSTLIILACGAAWVVAEGLIIAAATNWNTMSAADRAAFEPVGLSLRGVGFAGFTASVLGVLVITGEYATGLARATFCAVPRRLPVLWAKAAVFAAVVFAATLISALAAFLGSQALYGPHGVSLGDPAAQRAVLGAALAVTGLGLLGLGLGFLTRSTAGGIAAVAGLTFVLQDFRVLLPDSWQHSIVPYFPGEAAQAVYAVATDNGGVLHPWQGFAVLCGYTAVAITAAGFALWRRDA